MDKQRKIIVSHPTGNANSRSAVNGLYKKGILDSFHTCIACFKHSFLYYISKGPLKEFKRREFSLFLKKYTYTYPHKELCRLLAQKLKQTQWITHETGIFCIDKIYHNIDQKVSQYLEKKQASIDAIYTYEDCALASFQSAKKFKKLCLYDLPIGYWRAMHQLLTEEQHQNPQWATTLGGLNDSPSKLQRKDEELALADKIYVASTFTKKTLSMYHGKLSEIEVIPYGFPPINTNRKYTPFENRKIKVLFVGGLSQRKGISYFFESIKGLEDKLDVTVVGKGNIENCPILKESLSKIKYIPSLPHHEVLKLMSTQDLFIFPSLFEGFGLVITEAMSQGTPVITTDRTCGPDIITHGENGWIVKAGDSTPIRTLLEQFIQQPNTLILAGKAALKTADSRPWSCYEKELSQSIYSFINEKLS